MEVEIESEWEGTDRKKKSFIHRKCVVSFEFFKKMVDRRDDEQQKEWKPEVDRTGG
jgi:hypothetical protein